MVKYLAIAAALVFSLMVADQAQARGRRGCSSCGGCPGGVCSVPVSHGKDGYSSVPPGVAPVAADYSAPVVATAPAQPAPTYYTSSTRRGLFGWRR